MFDGAAFGKEVVGIVKTHMDRAITPVLARLDALERRMSELPAPKAFDDTAIRKDIDALRKAVSAIPAAPELPDIPAMVKAAVDHAISALPQPKDGEPGQDADPEEVAAIVSAKVADDIENLRSMIDAIPMPTVQPLPDIPAMVKEAVDAIEKPQDGRSPTTEEILPLVEACVSRAVSAIPVPKDGVNLAGAIIDRAGNLVVTLSDGSTRDLGPVVGKDGLDGNPGEPGKDGAPGKDGIDGVGFDDMDLVEDERGAFLTFTKGDVKKEFRLPIVVDRGVFKEGETYNKGDGVTWGGSFWICQGDAEGKPDSGKGWRLAVKKGRDGKDGTVKPETKPKVKV